MTCTFLKFSLISVFLIYYTSIQYVYLCQPIFSLFTKCTYFNFLNVYHGVYIPYYFNYSSLNTNIIKGNISMSTQGPKHQILLYFCSIKKILHTRDTESLYRCIVALIPKRTEMDNFFFYYFFFTRFPKKNLFRGVIFYFFNEQKICVY